ncbi:MAG: PAS domain S-box protein [candidate division Zixibacteria bacterium]|nr:PAS domain S-box protein [candidate division Zixibacteria bacterium]
MGNDAHEETYKEYIVNNIGKQNFQYLVENSLNGISIIRNNRIVYRNRRAVEIFGTLENRQNLLTADFIHPQDREVFENVSSKITGGFTGYLDYEFRFLPDESNIDSYRWVRNRASNVEVDGEMAVLIETTDITENKAMERVLRIQDKMNTVGKMAAGVAHQIRSPLSGLNLYISALKNSLLTSEVREESSKLLEQIEAASLKIESIVETVMQFSRSGPVRATPVDLNKTLKDSVSLIEASLKKSNITIHLRTDKDIPQFMGDPDIVEQVISNILVNAMEALEHKDDGEKAIEIRSFARGHLVIAKIGDSGPGIPIDKRDEIFEPFYSTKKGGTGLGLALNQRMITQFGGEIRVGTSSLGGAEFTIAMPLKKTSA